MKVFFKNGNEFKKLEKQYRDAIITERQKTEFFVNLTHELKTPISVILGAIQLIEQKKTLLEDDSANSLKHLHTVRQNCYRLLRLINNILDITKIDSGYTQLNLVDFNIVHLAKEITQSVLSFAEQKGISLQFDTQIEELTVAIDIDKIERILLNLLSNAIKFTDTGGKISVHISADKANITLSVNDTGLGIPKHMHHTIFERFRQVNNSLSREQHEGSGIGLSLVKSFVELHGGKITLISEENKGSEFIIELPIKHCETEIISGHAHSKDQQNRIIRATHVEFSDIYKSM